MIKHGVINSAQGILDFIPTQEKYWQSIPALTNKIVFSICGNLINIAKGIQALEDKNYNTNVGILARSFLELFVQYKFILDKETDLRAKSFYYNYKLNTGKKVKIMLEQSNSNLNAKEIQIMKNEVPKAKNYDDYINHYQTKVDELYDNPIKHNQKWYNLHGENRKFKELMLESGFRELDYIFFYGLGSLDAHGISSAVNMKIDDEIKFESSIPIEYIDESVVRWLNTALVLLVKFYKVDHKRKIKNYLQTIAISHVGIKF